MRKLRLSELGRLSEEEFRASEKFPLLLVLDNIRSFHNTGSVFRSADAFRISGIFLCGYTPCPPNREIHKTALGAEQSVAWEYHKNITDALIRLREEGWTLTALEHTDHSLPLEEFKPQPGEKIALLLGNEVDGISEEALKLCTRFVEIRQYGTKHSLNVSVAAGIVLHDVVEKMRIAGS